MINRVLIVHVATGGFSIEKNPPLELSVALVNAVGFDAHTRKHYRLAYPSGTLIAPEENTETPDGKMVIEAGAIKINGFSKDLWEETQISTDDADDRATDAVMAYSHGTKYPCYAMPSSSTQRWVAKYFPKLTEQVSEWRCAKQFFSDYCKEAGIPIEKGTLTLANMAKFAGYDDYFAYEGHTALQQVTALQRMLRTVHEMRARPRAVAG